MKLNVLFVLIVMFFSLALVSAQEKQDCCDNHPVGELSGATSDSVSSTQTTATCIVSGEPIAEGKAVTFRYMGNDFNFCCENCLAKFKKEPLNYINDQMLCPVMGDPVSKEFFVEHEGTKYYLCCESCLKRFRKDPEQYILK